MKIFLWLYAKKRVLKACLILVLANTGWLIINWYILLRNIKRGNCGILVIIRCHTVIWINTSGNRVHLQIRVRLLWTLRTRKMRIFHRSVCRKCWMTSTLPTTLWGMRTKLHEARKRTYWPLDLFRDLWCGDRWNIYSESIYLLWTWLASLADSYWFLKGNTYILLFDINLNKNTCWPSKFEFC